MHRRKKRSDLIGLAVAPGPRFWAGIIALPGFLLIQGILWKGVIVLIFAMLAILAGKRIQWLYFAMFTVSVTFFHLLKPVGKVIVELGALAVTEGALANGVSRSLSLAGMVFLSLAAVKPGIKLPGGFGGLLARTFHYFERIIEGKGRLKWKNLVPSLDAYLMECFNPRKENFVETAASMPKEKKTATGHSGWIWALIAGGLPWLVLGLVHTANIDNLFQ